MKRAVVRTALSVLVIAGWFVALLWVVLSVSQIAVERTLVPSSCASMVAVASPGEVACSP